MKRKDSKQLKGCRQKNFNASCTKKDTFGHKKKSGLISLSMNIRRRLKI